MPIVLSWSCTPALSLKVRAPAVARGTYREVNPYHTTFLFYQQFVVVLMTQVADVQQAAYRNACSIPMQRISTAHPVKWLLVDTPPTALFTSGLRNPLLMMMGSSPSPYRLFHLLHSCSSQRHRRFRFSTCSSLGTFSNSTFVLVNSRSEKCSERLVCLFI